MAELVAFVAGIGFVLTGLALRPPDTPIRWGATFGLLEGSRPLGRFIGILGILLATFGLIRICEGLF